MPADSDSNSYRGRIAPSPTGLLHLGHARTFSIAAECAKRNHGELLLRNEDLDSQRCRAEFVSAMFEDLRWLGIDCSEGPDCGGPHGPYAQSERRRFYQKAWKNLLDSGFIYPCTCSRKDVTLSAGAPNEGDDEPMYPGTCRPSDQQGAAFGSSPNRRGGPRGVIWRLRVADEGDSWVIDQCLGSQWFAAL